MTLAIPDCPADFLWLADCHYTTLQGELGVTALLAGICIPLLSKHVKKRVLLPEPQPTCVAVFHFPQALTATALLAAGPSVAAHSLSADIVISRPMMTAAGDSNQKLDPFCLTQLVQH